jgi:cysteine synthase A
MSAHIYQNITEKIGKTPLIRLNRLNTTRLTFW